MRTNYVLIDYENVQPTDLGLLKDGPFRVKVFVGAHQSKIPVGLASALQPLGDKAEYIVLEAGGKNALDFHIAYYIGLLSREQPSACFYVISKDNGFDPLVKHLKGKKVSAQRAARIADILTPTVTPETPNDDRITLAVDHLVRMKAAKPRTQKTLLSTLNALFKKKLSKQQLTELLEALCNRGFVRVEDKKVSYELPITI